ncbi:biotin/lipoyl-binding protein [Chryseobacterium sp. MEBOG07]
MISFAPKVTGRILKIYVSEGQTVKKEIPWHNLMYRKFLQK